MANKNFIEYLQYAKLKEKILNDINSQVINRPCMKIAETRPRVFSM